MRKEDKYTYELLYGVSKRLASREDCKDVEYKITISDKYIYMEPDVDVFPNTHSRSQSDKRSVINHILWQLYIEDSDLKFVPGIYVYQKSINSRRRWTRKM